MMAGDLPAISATLANTSLALSRLATFPRWSKWVLKTKNFLPVLI